LELEVDSRQHAPVDVGDLYNNNSAVYLRLGIKRMRVLYSTRNVDVPEGGM
jgi:hypothetical protein